MKHLHGWCQELFSLGVWSCSHKQLDKFSVDTCVELGCTCFVLAEVQVQLNEIQMGRTPTNCHSNHLSTQNFQILLLSKVFNGSVAGDFSSCKAQSCNEGFRSYLYFFVCFSVDSTIVP